MYKDDKGDFEFIGREMPSLDYGDYHLPGHGGNPRIYGGGVIYIDKNNIPSDREEALVGKIFSIVFAEHDQDWYPEPNGVLEISEVMDMVNNRLVMMYRYPYMRRF
jgi:hypothetical protein